MRIIIILLAYIMVCHPAYAVEPVTDQQVMLYYQIPFGGKSQKERKHNFGIRLDQTQHQPGEIIHINKLVQKPAIMDLQFRKDEKITFKIHGVDYSNRLLVHRADESGGEQPEMTGTDAEETGESQQETTAETGDEQQEKNIVQKSLDELPKGVIIGVAIGVVLLSGVGG